MLGAQEEEIDGERDDGGRPSGKPDDENVEGNRSEQVEIGACLDVEHGRNRPGQGGAGRNEPRHERVVPDPFVGVGGVGQRMTVARRLRERNIPEVIGIVRPSQARHGLKPRREGGENHRRRDRVAGDVNPRPCGRAHLTRRQSRRGQDFFLPRIGVWRDYHATATFSSGCARAWTSFPLNSRTPPREKERAACQETLDRTAAGVRF